MNNHRSGLAPGIAGLVIAALAAGCTAPPQPIRYVASNRPWILELEQSVDVVDASTIEEGRIRFGLLYRAPIDVAKLVSNFELKHERSVLQNVELRLAVPFCYTIFCIGRDTLSSNVESEVD